MSCKGECSLRNFGLSHPHPELFVKSQWKIPQPIYFVYRILVAIFFIVFIILSGAIDYGWYNRKENSIKWLIYLTNWMFFVMTVDSIVQVIVVGISLRRCMSGYSYTPWYFKAQWVIYNLSSGLAIAVSLLYWALIYPRKTRSIHYTSIIKHGVNSGYVLINLFITGIPTRIQHFWQTMLFGIIFLVFSVIYDVAGGTNALDKPYIYSAIDWTADTGNSALYAFVAVAVSITVWLLLYGLYWIRITLANCCGCMPKNRDENNEIV